MNRNEGEAMSDLISRSKVISVLKQLNEHSLSGKMDISNAIYLIEKQTTAYDIDNVVNELESFVKLAEDRLVNGTSKYAYQERKCWVKAIEIVKHGCASDDVCEWKQTSTAKYKTECGYKLEEYFDTNACYCKQCGKKIKVVE